MFTHRYIVSIFISAVISWVAFLLVLFKLSPLEHLQIALSLFFVSLAIALACSFALFGFFFRYWRFKEEIVYRQLNVALRQGVILSFIVVFSLIFQLLGVLTWWSGGLLIFIALLLEFYFSSRDAVSY